MPIAELNPTTALSQSPANDCPPTPPAAVGQERYDYQAVFQRLTQSLPGLVYRVNVRQNNRIDFLNSQSETMTGYSTAELSGGTVCGLESLIYPDDRHRVTGEIEQAITSRQPFVVEYRLRHKDGNLRHLSERGMPVFTEEGALEFIDGIIFDVTLQRQAEEELRRVSLLNAQIISSANDGIIVYGKDLRYLVWNPCMERISGKKASEVLGRHPLEIFPFLREVGVIEQLEKTLQGQESSTLEFPNLSDTGNAGWSSDSCSPLRDASGEIIGVIGIVRDITAQKQADLALKNSENMLQAIIDTEPECVKLLDAEARLILMNRAGLDMIEVESLEQVKGQCVCPMIVAEHWDAFMGLTRRVFQGESGTLVFEMVGAKGRRLWLETHAVPFRNENGDITALLGITRDITASRQAEEALKQSRERYQALYDETPIMLHSIDRTGCLVDVNNYWLVTMGYERHEVIGRKVTDFYTEGSRRFALEVIQPAFFRDGYCKEVPYQFVKKSGELIDVLLSASSERDAAGEVVRSRAVIEDITERKRAAERLRQNEQLIRSILDNVDEEFVVVDREFKILTANAAYCRHSGVADLEVAGRHCYEVSHRSRRPCYEHGEECAIHQVFATGRPATAIHIHDDGKGESRHVETRGFPLFDAAGNLTSAIEVIHDITDRHRLEAEQLKTQKLEAIGTLAGGIAHDFNNLLQGIFGYLSMAKLSIDQREVALAALDQAEKALGLSTNLTMQLLTFAKGGKPVKKLADIRPVIDNSAKFALSGSNCECHVQLPEDLWLAEIDEGQIGQVVQNIVLNAAQAMPTGGRIEVAGRNCQAPGGNLPAELNAGDYLEIAIRDNGPGIAAQYLGKIFDPYFTTKASGSGLGLATSYSIVNNHGGMIAVHSELGNGSVFTIYLPALRQEIPRPMPSAAPNPVTSESRTTGKILFMDDDQVICHVASQMIEALGYSVEIASHGEEAIAKYRQALEAGVPFALVILDLTIRGGMGGFDTLHHLRAIAPDVKAVVSSGYSDDGTLAGYATAGFNACLHKPYSIMELKETLAGLL